MSKLDSSSSSDTRILITPQSPSVKRWLSLKELPIEKALTIHDANRAVKLKQEHEHYVPVVAKTKAAEEMLLKMRVEVKSIKTWAKVQLSSIVITESKNQGIKNNSNEYLTTVCQLNSVFASNASPSIGEKVWQCFFGVFDKRKLWDLALEQEFMTSRHWAYREMRLPDFQYTSRAKGCVAKIIRAVKNQMVDTLNKGSNGTHQNKICITRPSSMIKTDPHNRRAPCLFQPYFYKNIAGEAVVVTPTKDWNNTQQKKNPQIISSTTCSNDVNNNAEAVVFYNQEIRRLQDMVTGVSKINTMCVS